MASAMLNLIVIHALMSVALAATVAPLTLLSAATAPLARCLDGTQSGYYLLPASAPMNATKWIFSLEGGGECTTASACAGALNSALGSSKYFPAQLDFSGPGAQFNEATPGSTAFASWAHVQVPYCTQDLHTGQRVTRDPAAYNLYFAGHHVFEAVLDALDNQTPSLRDATDIVLSGDSAGGIGVWPHLNWLQARYPKARVVGAPIAGFYFYAYPYQGVNHTTSTLSDFRPPAWPQHFALWQSFVDAACAGNHSADPSPCLLANYSLPYVGVEVFAAEAQTDAVQLTAHDWVPAAYVDMPPERAYLAAWRDNMTAALAPLLDPSQPRMGAFNPACFIHTDFYTDKPKIAGKSYMDAFEDFYFRRTPPAGYKLADDCGIMCNADC